MKIFISSLIRGFEDFRAAAAGAIRALGHEPVMAEDFAASASSPRIACLDGVRRADMVILLMGEGYGAVQDVSALSATHEEYREAKDNRPVISFFQTDAHFDARQTRFVREVQDWSGGLLGGPFRTAEELRDAVTKAIHRYEVSAATTPVDPSEMLARALEIIPRGDTAFYRRSGPLLHLAVVGGPAQTIIRPAEIEAPELARALLRNAIFGEQSIFDAANGSKPRIQGGSLVLEQDGGATMVIDERGAIRLSVPIARGEGMLGALIEENVSFSVNRAVAHSAEVLGQIDGTERLSRVAVAAVIEANGAFGWRTREENAANLNSMTMTSMHSPNDRPPVHFQPPDRARAALLFDRATIVSDLVTLLRRQWQ